ncbi:MAG: hypothetical protein QM715_07125 [Nibricoccus sp.]
MILPSLPLKLKNSFVWKFGAGGALLILLGLAVAVAFGWWQMDNAQEILKQSRIWKSGVPAGSAEAGGRVTTRKFVFHEYDLDVAYLDQKGAVHRGKLKFDTLFNELEKDSDPVVRYDPAHPEDFALSWAVNRTGSRWASVIFMLLAGIGLIGGSAAILGVKALRSLADARRCARRSDEVIVQVTQVVEQNAKGKTTGYEYQFAGQLADGRSVNGKVVFPVKHEPLYADNAHQTMVALVSQEKIGSPVVLRDDFYPLALTEDEKAKARSALAGKANA